VPREVYSKEFRWDMLAASDVGEMTCDVATRSCLPKSRVRQIKQDGRESGKVAAKTTHKRVEPERQLAPWIAGFERARYCRFPGDDPRGR